MIRSSKAAVELIVSEEVGGKDLYVKKYQRPEWPGGASGITVGIGYDLGYATATRIMEDWKDYLSPDVIRAMQRYAGVTGGAAHQVLAEARVDILVPWDAAMAVFTTRDLPKWEDIVLRNVPGSEKLPAGCFGVLTSLSYNRGASFSKDGDRYKEMRAIRTHVASGEWDLVPADLRSMARLWPDMAGLRRRRDNEAKLWEASLAAYHPIPEETEGHVDTGDEHEDVTPAGNETKQGEERPLNVRASTAKFDVGVEVIQRYLTAMHYHEVGEIDGKAGGKLRGAIAAFMNDRGKPPVGEITPEFQDELNKALKEGWSRPIAPARANATTSDLAPKVASVNPIWYQKIGAFILGIPAFVTAGFKAVFGEQSTPLGYVQAVKDFFGAIPQEFYWLAVAGVALWVFVQAKKAQDATVKAYQEGKIN